MWIVYFALGFTILMFGAIFIGFIVAAIYDAWYQRRYRVFIELQKEYNKREPGLRKRRRPACKQWLLKKSQ